MGSLRLLTLVLGVACLSLLVFSPESTWAQEAETAAPLSLEEQIAAQAAALETLRKETNTLWTVIAACLVMFMQPGFAMLEAGFTRARNVLNILMKNVMDFSMASIAFWAVGFALMFGGGVSGLFQGWIGADNWFFSGDGHDAGFLFFQTVFAGTAATIVSGAMAERTRFMAYIVFSLIMCSVIYPIYGHWAWASLAGNDTGWLENLPATIGLPAFHDFAGSTVVHSMGGWAALAGALVLGPRIGKYVNGQIQGIPGHNIPLAVLGAFILWFGWFGFNAGSTTSVDGASFATIALNTNLAASAGVLAGIFVSWQWFGKPDPSFAINGALAGLVAITCPCDGVTAAGSIMIGAVAGVIVVFSAVFIETIGIDDPVGAVSVHGVCGAWGTFSFGLFAIDGGLFYGGGVSQLASQMLGITAAFVWCFPVSIVLFLFLKTNMRLRVTSKVEREGLDIHEHGLTGYPVQWVVTSARGYGPAHVPTSSVPMSASMMPASEDRHVPRSVPPSDVPRGQGPSTGR